MRAVLSRGLRRLPHLITRRPPRTECVLAKTRRSFRHYDAGIGALRRIGLENWERGVARDIRVNEAEPTRHVFSGSQSLLEQKITLGSPRGGHDAAL